MVGDDAILIFFYLTGKKKFITWKLYFSLVSCGRVESIPYKKLSFVDAKSSRKSLTKTTLQIGGPSTEVHKKWHPFPSRTWTEKVCVDPNVPFWSTACHFMLAIYIKGFWMRITRRRIERKERDVVQLIKLQYSLSPYQWIHLGYWIKVGWDDLQSRFLWGESMAIIRSNAKSTGASMKWTHLTQIN